MTHDYEYVANTFKIKLKGEVFEITEPTNKQSNTFYEQYEACKDDSRKVVQAYVDFLATLGIPKEKLDLPFRAVLDIFSLVTGSKKN